MTRDQIVQILESEEGKFTGGVLALRDEKEATCFVSSPAEILPISRVVKVELREPLIVLQTAKEERFFFQIADILGFRFAVATTTKERATGFGGR